MDNFILIGLNYDFPCAGLYCSRMGGLELLNCTWVPIASLTPLCLSASSDWLSGLLCTGVNGYTRWEVGDNLAISPSFFSFVWSRRSPFQTHTTQTYLLNEHFWFSLEWLVLFSHPIFIHCFLCFPPSPQSFTHLNTAEAQPEPLPSP